MTSNDNMEMIGITSDHPPPPPYKINKITTAAGHLIMGDT